MSQKVSVIVPVYNVQEFVDECVESIVNQTYGNLEIILVNDGSTDASPLHLEAWERRDPRVRVVNKPNGGLSSARNAGLDVATGDLVGFVDSDDLLTPDFYARLVDAMADPTVGIACSHVTAFDHQRRWSFQPKWDVEKPTRTSSAHFAIDMIENRVCMTAWSKLYRAELLKNVRFREGRNNEDSLFHFELSPLLEKAGLDMLTIPDACYLYRIRQGSICNNRRTPLHLDMLRNLEEFLFYYRTNSDPRERQVRLVYDRILFFFLQEIIANPFWVDKYYYPYRRRLAAIPLSELKEALPTESDYRVALALRFVPGLYLRYKRRKNRAKPQ